MNRPSFGFYICTLSPRAEDVMARAVWNPLSKDEEDAIHAESLRILEEVGIKVTSSRVFKMLAGLGAPADERTQVIRLPEELIKESLSKAPKEFVMAGREKNHDLHLPAGEHIQGCNDGQPTEVWDIDAQQKRKSTARDLVDLTIVCDAMPEVDLYWPQVVATDIPPGASNLHEFVASLFFTGKHIQHGAGSASDARYIIRVAAAVVGGERELEKRPIASITHTPITPLRFEEGDVDAVVEFARAGLPVVHLSMAISGSVAPVTLAGTIALVNAENLAGCVISQSARAGAPILFSSESGPMDMRTGVFLSGSTEGALINAAGCQMARRYGIPSQVGGVAASGCVPGFEVGYQKAISGLLPAMAGADQVVGIGGFDRSGCESMEQIVMDCELWRNVLRACRGIRVDAETLGFDAISRVGPGGCFMKDLHTLRHFKQEILLPKLAMRAKTSSTAVEPMVSAAREEVKRILREHRAPELDSSVKKMVLEILAESDIETHGARVPTRYLDRQP